MEPRIQYAKTGDGARIAFATLGSGPPLVCLPPWPIDLELTWDYPEAREPFLSLAARNALVVPTRRGIGGSQGSLEELTLDTQVADLEAVVAHAGLDKIDLFGCDDGAIVCAAYARRHPDDVRHLVLWAPYAHGIGSERPTHKSFANLASENWGLARKTIADILFPSGPLEARMWFENNLKRAMPGDVAAKYLDYQADLDGSRELADLGVQTLVLYRRHEKNVPMKVTKAAAALVPDATIVPLDGDISHPFLGDTTYTTIISRFLHGEPDLTATPTRADVRTILFTDMQSSTSITQRLGDAKAQEVRRAHNQIVRAALQSTGGSEIKHTGDGIMASFTTASAALDCAIAIQRGVAEHVRAHPDTPLALYVGLNAGEPIAEGDPEGRIDLFGTSVDLAARICDHAKPGQILAADVVRQLAAGKDFLFADLGETALRGFEDPVKLWELRWQGSD